MSRTGFSLKKTNHLQLDYKNGPTIIFGGKKGKKKVIIELREGGPISTAQGRRKKRETSPRKPTVRVPRLHRSVVGLQETSKPYHCAKSASWHCSSTDLLCPTSLFVCNTSVTLVYLCHPTYFCTIDFPMVAAQKVTGPGSHESILEHDFKIPEPTKLVLAVDSDNESAVAQDSASTSDSEDCFSPPRMQRKSSTDFAPASPRVISNLRVGQMLEGTSGVYLLTNEKGVGVAVFKPLDEENLPQEASTWSVTNGMAYFRERAAYVVSDEILEGYSGVPTTVIATVRHEGWAGGEKRGSLQRFVPESTDMSDMGPANIPAEEVQKVGILDILLFNMDRHEGNLLLLNDHQRSSKDSGSLSLVPIDHGLCLPEIISQHSGPNHELLRSIYFVWQNWPQARLPFSDAVRRLLDRQLADDFFRSVVVKLRRDMGRNSLTCGALTTLKIGAMVLRDSVRSGLNLSEIADFVQTALPGMLQKSWEEAGRRVKASVKSKAAQCSAGNTKEHSADAQAAAGAAAAAAAAARREAGEVVPVLKRSASALTLSMEEDDRMYLVWEAQLLRDLEIRLSIALCSRSSDTNGGKHASADAVAEGQKEGREVKTESLYSRFEEDAVRGGWVRGHVEVQNDVAKSALEVGASSARIVLLDDDYQAGSADACRNNMGESERVREKEVEVVAEEGSCPKHQHSYHACASLRGFQRSEW